MLNALHRSCWAVAMCASVLAASFADAQSTWAGRKLAAGEFFSAQLAADGTVWSWGENTNGELGDGTVLNRSLPTLAIGLANVTSISAGNNHMLALTTGGDVYAWGANDDGQLASNRTARLEVRPLKVSALTQVVAVSAYGSTSAAVAGGNVWLWGRAVTRSVPARMTGAVQSGETPIGVVIGLDAGITVLSNRTMRVWSMSPSLTSSSAIVARSDGSPLTGVVRVAGDDTTFYAVTDDGQAWKFGGAVAEKITLPGSVAAADVAAGRGQVAWVSAAGAMFMQGDNTFGQLGISIVSGVTTALSQVQNISNARAVAASRYHTVASTTAGKSFAWGYNAFGELGSGARQYVSEPLHAIDLGSYALVSPGRKHTLGLASVSPSTGAGALYAWGSNENGQAGASLFLTSTIATPGRVLSGTQFIDASAGNAHSAAVAEDGSVYTFGSNAQGQLGSGTFGGQAQPAKISGVSAVRAIAAGARSTHALTADGQIYSWGNNSSAQLGTGTADSSASPVRTLAPGSARYTAVVAAATHVAALASDGGLWVWGGNRFGQLGNGNIAVASDGTPKRVSFPDGSTARVTAVRLGFSSTLALREDGTVWLWGETRQGGTPTYSPQQMSGLPKIVAIAASGYSYSALGVDGSLWAWGRNASISPTTFRSTMSFAQAAGGPFADSMFARDTGGRWWATGYNGYSQLGLGDPSRVQETLPIEVYLPFASTSTVTTVQELFTDKIGPAGERFFLSADVAQSGLLDTLKAADGTYFWGRTGRGFRAWPTRDGAPANVSEVYRFYCLFPDGKPNTHFYTANPADKTALQATNPTNETGRGCRYEGVAFYAVAPSFTAYTGAASAGLVGQSCPSGYQPVYRAYNNRSNLNDGNHRMSTSWVDHLRAVRYLGYTDEGVVFCSPTTTVAGGDLHAYHSYPGPEVKAGDRIRVEYIFANNGPGHGNGARVSAVIPTAVTDWTMSCTSRLGGICPDAGFAALRTGVTLDALPAGGSVVFTLNGTAPSLPAGSTATTELRFANSIVAAASAPDVYDANDTTRYSSTQVRAPQLCSYGLSVNQVAIAAAGGSATSAVVTNAACALSASVTAATQGGVAIPSSWLTVSLPNGATGAANFANNVVKVVATTNPGPLSRSATVTVNGQALTVFQEAPPPAVPSNCVNQLQPSSEHAAVTGYNSRTVAVSAPSLNCQWKAAPDVDWITIVSTANGTGAGLLTYAILANATGAPRSGRIVIGNTALEVYQEGTGGGGAEGGGGDGGGEGGGSSGGEGGSAGS